MIVERLKELCDEKGVSFVQFERESGIGINTAKRWDTNAPNVWKVKQAADYFGVTVSYIIGETNKKTAVQMDNGTEKDIVDLLMSASPEQRSAILQFLKTFESR